MDDDLISRIEGFVADLRRYAEETERLADSLAEYARVRPEEVPCCEGATRCDRRRVPGTLWCADHQPRGTK